MAIFSDQRNIISTNQEGAAGKILIIIRMEN